MLPIIQGCQSHENLSLREVSGTNRTVVASGKISSGSLLIKVPDSAVIKPDSVKFKDEGKVTTSNWLRTVLAVMIAMVDPETPHRAYIDSLPAKYDTFASWTAEDLDELKGTSAASVASLDPKGEVMRSRYKEAIVPRIGALSTEANLRDALLSGGFSLFEAASNAVVTRGFNSEDGNGPYMIPLVDLLNHCDDDPCTTLRKTEEGWTMIAERDVPDGAEVMHRYSVMTASQSLCTYGFASETGTAEVEVTCEELQAAAEKFRTEQGNASDTWENNKEYIDAMGRLTVLSDQVVSAATVLVLDREEVEAIFDGPGVTLEKDTVLGDEDIGEAVIALLVVLINTKLSEFAGGSVKEDEELLKTAEGRMRTALLVRIGEKKVLESAKLQLLSKLSQEEGNEKEEDREGGEVKTQTKRIKLF